MHVKYMILISSVFNLCNGNEVEETKRKIDQYKKENKEFIAKNKSKLVRIGSQHIKFYLFIINIDNVLLSSNIENFNGNILFCNFGMRYDCIL